MKPQIVQMSETEYHSNAGLDLPALSASVANVLLNQSAEHAWMVHPLLGGQPFEPTDAKDGGTLMHSVLLRSNDPRIKIPIAATDVYVYKGTKREELRYKAGEAFRDYGLQAAQDARDSIRAAGGIPTLQSDVDAAAKSAEEVRRKFKPHWLIADPQSHAVERVVLWEETASNGMAVQCRARMDIVEPRTGEIEDLKTCRSAHPKAARAHVEAYGGVVQHGAYVSALEHALPALAGRVRYHWVFVESARPHAVLRARPAGSMRTLGEALWRRAVDQWAHCLETGVWAGYNIEDVEFESSPWAMTALIEAEEGSQAA